MQIITMPDSEGSKLLSKVQNISNKMAGEEPLEAYAPVKNLAVEAGLSIAYYPVAKLNGKAFVKADHNKMLSVDGEEALIGGMNFADVVSDNHDIMLWIKGPAVTELVTIFSDNWRICGGQDLFLNEAVPIWSTSTLVEEAVREKSCRNLAQVTVAYSNAYLNATRGMVRQLIDGAKEKIRIVMFTFTDDDTVDRLIAAHERGVDVSVILDPNVHAFGLRLMGRVSAARIEIASIDGVEQSCSSPMKMPSTPPSTRQTASSSRCSARYWYASAVGRPPRRPKHQTGRLSLKASCHHRESEPSGKLRLSFGSSQFSSTR